MPTVRRYLQADAGTTEPKKCFVKPTPVLTASAYTYLPFDVSFWVSGNMCR